MDQVLARPIGLPMAARRKLTPETVVAIIGTIVVVVLALVAATWTVSEKIGNVRDSLISTIQAGEQRLSGRIDGVGDRVTNLENRFSALDAALRAERETRTQERGEIQKRFGEVEKDQQQTEQRAAAIARANVERTMALTQVLQFEARILPSLRPNTRTMVGTLLSVVPGEKALAIETADGKSRAFVIADEVVAKGFCGTYEETLKVTDLKRGTAILVAYDMVGGRGTARVVVKSSCA